MGKKKAKAKNYFQAKKYCKSIIEVFLKMRKLKKKYANISNKNMPDTDRKNKKNIVKQLL